MRPRMRYGLFLLGLSLALLTGCTTVSVGNEQLRSISAENIHGQIIDGKTTKDEIRSRFGGPSSMSFTNDGLLVWTYDFEILSQKFPFTPQLEGHKKLLTILFNTDGSVKDFAYEQSKIARNVSLFFGM